jgi:hypothetical protein
MIMDTAISVMSSMNFSLGALAESQVKETPSELGGNLFKNVTRPHETRAHYS